MKSPKCMFLVVITYIIFLNSPFVRGRHFGNTNSIVKTIKDGNQNVIDCIDVHKQLAFTHPLLVNHSIQMEPSMQMRLSSKSQLEREVELRQSWHKYGQCPQGSIPVSRKDYNISRNLPPKKYVPSSIYNNNEQPGYQCATTRTEQFAPGTIHGATATINLWYPFVNPSGESISQIWITAGRDPNGINTIEAGWRVSPGDGDYNPRLFVYWTIDSYRSTGCINLQCPGFVQTNKDIEVGTPLTNPSVYGGQQTVIPLHIQRDPKTGNWWLSMQSRAIGYWPSAIFTNLGYGADRVIWGGQIYDATSKDDKTITQMGSGHFPSEGVGKSSYIREIKYIDSTSAVIAPSRLYVVTTKPWCYDATMVKFLGFSLLYGGPGCQPI